MFPRKLTQLGGTKWLIFLSTLPWSVTPWTCVGMCLHAPHTSQGQEDFFRTLSPHLLSPPAQILHCRRSPVLAHSWLSFLTCSALRLISCTLITALTLSSGPKKPWAGSSLDTLTEPDPTAKPLSRVQLHFLVFMWKTHMPSGKQGRGYLWHVGVILLTV